MTSKRRSNKINLLSLSFVSKCISKAFLIKILKASNLLKKMLKATIKKTYSEFS